MAREPFHIGLQELASQTLMIAGHPLLLYGRSRGEIVQCWEDILSMCRFADDGSIDWVEFRNVLWNGVPAEVLKDDLFRVGLSSILVELYGPAVGYEGIRKVLIRR